MSKNQIRLLIIAFCINLSISKGQNIITTFAGTSGGFSGDGGQATFAQMNNPTGLVFDASGNLFIADNNNKRIRKVDTLGVISTIAGIGTYGYSGDGGQASLCEFRSPVVITIDLIGNLYIADEINSIVRVINTSGIINLAAGTPVGPGYSGDGGKADTAKLNRPNGVFYDTSTGTLYIADTYNSVIRSINSSGIISTVVGNGTSGFSGDGGNALAAQLSYPQGIFIDQNGNMYIGDTGNNRIRIVNTNGIINTMAGIGTAGYSGDGGPALLAQLKGPCGVKLDAGGNLFVADYFNHVIRKIDPAFTISTIAGSTQGFSGDGGPATSAKLYFPNDIAITPAGDMFIADQANHRIRKVTNVAVGIKDETSLEKVLVIYPNPNAGVFRISFQDKAKNLSVEIYDILGQLVQEVIYQTEEERIDVSHLPNGIYFLHIQTSEGTLTKKIIIQH